VSTPEVIALVLQGGAVVVLYLWVADLKDQRKHQDKLREQERAERLENASVMRETSQALGVLTKSIEAIVEHQSPRPPRQRQ
jgi:hypothetical protein